jgi:hypothetical protein
MNPNKSISGMYLNKISGQQQFLFLLVEKIPALILINLKGIFKPPKVSCVLSEMYLNLFIIRVPHL